MKFSTKNILKIINKYQFSLNTEKNRIIIFNELNDTFFPDNIAKFIDITKNESDHLSVMIEYKDTQYNILAYKVDVRKKVERIRKLKKINENI